MARRQGVGPPLAARSEMRLFLRFTLTAMASVAVAAGVIYWLTGEERAGRSLPVVLDPRAHPPTTPRVAPPSTYPSPRLLTFADPNAPPGSSDRVFLDP